MKHLVLFAKPPLPGRSKTRLAEKIGGEAAARIAEAMLADSVTVCEEIADRFAGNELHLVLAHTDSPDWFDPLLSSNWRMIPQRGTNLGERIEKLLADLDPNPQDRTLFIGMDSPHMPAERIFEAFESLDDASAVLGPCDDGGYYLLGVRGDVPDGALKQVRWSTTETLEDTVAAFEGANMTVAGLSPGYDVDTADDLRRLAGEIANNGVDGLTNLTEALAEIEL